MKALLFGKKDEASPAVPRSTSSDALNSRVTPAARSRGQADTPGAPPRKNSSRGLFARPAHRDSDAVAVSEPTLISASPVQRASPLAERDGSPSGSPRSSTFVSPPRKTGSPRTPAASGSLRGLNTSLRGRTDSTADRAKSLAEVPRAELVSALEEVRRMSCIALRVCKSEAERIALMEIVDRIDRCDGHVSARVALLDADISIRLLRYATECGLAHWVSFWLTAREFENGEKSIRASIGDHLMQRYVVAGAIDALGVDEAVRKATEDAYTAAAKSELPGDLFAPLQAEVEALIDRDLMPGFEPPSKSPGYSSPKAARKMTTTNKETGTIRSELQDAREQAEAWKASYIHAKDQLAKSEKAFQKMLASYHKDEEKIVELKQKLRDAKRGAASKGPLRSPTATPGPVHEAVSAPTLTKRITDSTPVTLGEFDRFALNRKRTVKDFAVRAIVGKGNYGVVFMVTEAGTDRCLAIKRMSKCLLIERNQVLTIMTEALVMKEATSDNNPWLVQLHYAWNDPNYLYLAMDFCHGGDLRSVLDNVELEENAVRFFAAEMISAVNALHTRGYAHRDLKPDNFLLHRSGHIKLADFGLSKAGYELQAGPSGQATKIVAQAMRVFLDESTHQTMIVSPSTTAQDLVLQLREKCTLSSQKDYVLYEEGISAVDPSQGFLKEIAGNASVTELAEQWIVSRAGGPPDLRFRLILKERPPAERAFRKKLVKRTVVAPPRDPYWQPPKVNKREKLYSVVGTPSYMAREILEGEGYEAVVDWWSVGCIIFEMLVGDLPFSGATPEDLFQQVLNSEETLSFPSERHISSQAQDIVRRFLSPPKERLGYNGVGEIKSHPFFSGIDFDRLHEMEPPFVPEVSDDFDLSYFGGARTSGIPAQLDEPFAEEQLEELVFDPFAKEWDFSVRP